MRRQVPRFDARKMSGYQSNLTQTQTVPIDDELKEGEYRMAKHVFATYLNPTSKHFLEKNGIKKSTVKQLYMIKPIDYKQ